MSKTCKQCNVLYEDLTANFYFKNKKTGLREKICKECYKLKNQKYKENNAAKFEAFKSNTNEAILYRRARWRAIRDNLEFNINLSDIVIPENCPLLGIKLERGKGKACDSSPSLDRIDSSKGYVKDNIWVISYRANTIKNNATLIEFELIYNNWRNLIVS